MLSEHQNQPIDLGTPEDDIPEDTKIKSKNWKTN